jgi:hypothetical protein
MAKRAKLTEMRSDIEEKNCVYTKNLTEMDAGIYCFLRYFGGWLREANV